MFTQKNEKELQEILTALKNQKISSQNTKDSVSEVQYPSSKTSIGFTSNFTEKATTTDAKRVSLPEREAWQNPQNGQFISNPLRALSTEKPASKHTRTSFIKKELSFEEDQQLSVEIENFVLSKIGYNIEKKWADWGGIKIDGELSSRSIDGEIHIQGPSKVFKDSDSSKVEVTAFAVNSEFGIGSSHVKASSTLWGPHLKGELEVPIGCFGENLYTIGAAAKAGLGVGYGVNIGSRPNKTNNKKNLSFTLAYGQGIMGQFQVEFNQYQQHPKCKVKKSKTEEKIQAAFKETVLNLPQIQQKTTEFLRDFHKHNQNSLEILPSSIPIYQKYLQSHLQTLIHGSYLKNGEDTLYYINLIEHERMRYVQQKTEPLWVNIDKKIHAPANLAFQQQLHTHAKKVEASFKEEIIHSFKKGIEDHFTTTKENAEKDWKEQLNTAQELQFFSSELINTLSYVENLSQIAGLDSEENKMLFRFTKKSLNVCEAIGKAVEYNAATKLGQSVGGILGSLQTLNVYLAIPCALAALFQLQDDSNSIGHQLAKISKQIEECTLFLAEKIDALRKQIEQSFELTNQHIRNLHHDVIHFYYDHKVEFSVIKSRIYDLQAKLTQHHTTVYSFLESLEKQSKITFNEINVALQIQQYENLVLAPLVDIERKSLLTSGDLQALTTIGTKKAAFPSLAGNPQESEKVYSILDLSPFQMIIKAFYNINVLAHLTEVSFQKNLVNPLVWREIVDALYSFIHTKKIEFSKNALENIILLSHTGKALSLFLSQLKDEKIFQSILFRFKKNHHDLLKSYAKWSENFSLQANSTQSETHFLNSMKLYHAKLEKQASQEHMFTSHPSWNPPSSSLSSFSQLSVNLDKMYSVRSERNSAKDSLDEHNKMPVSHVLLLMFTGVGYIASAGRAISLQSKVNALDSEINYLQSKQNIYKKNLNITMEEYKFILETWRSTEHLLHKAEKKKMFDNVITQQKKLIQQEKLQVTQPDFSKNLTQLKFHFIYPRSTNLILTLEEPEKMNLLNTVKNQISLGQILDNLKCNGIGHEVYFYDFDAQGNMVIECCFQEYGKEPKVIGLLKLFCDVDTSYSSDERAFFFWYGGFYAKKSDILTFAFDLASPFSNQNSASFALEKEYDAKTNKFQFYHASACLVKNLAITAELPFENKVSSVWMLDSVMMDYLNKIHVELKTRKVHAFLQTIQDRKSQFLWNPILNNLNQYLFLFKICLSLAYPTIPPFTSTNAEAQQLTYYLYNVLYHDARIQIEAQLKDNFFQDTLIEDVLQRLNIAPILEEILAAFKKITMRSTFPLLEDGMKKLEVCLTKINHESSTLATQEFSTNSHIFLAPTTLKQEPALPSNSSSEASNTLSGSVAKSCIA